MRVGASALQLEKRSRLLTAIRQFFLSGGFTEVETPVRLIAPALEMHIDAIPSGHLFLRTSPELHMKRLLAEGIAPIYQMGPCFRADEHGDWHRTEFTLLEWYRLHADYKDILTDTENLIRSVALELGSAKVDVQEPWVRMTVSQAYRRFAGWDPVGDFEPDRFDGDMVNKIEPALPPDRVVVLMDYPAEVAALARRSPSDPRIAERWELYMGGLEIANAFSELTDAREQRLRFEQCALQRARHGADVYPMDKAFLACLEAGLPDCAGIALGVDRLLMALTGVRSIEEVQAFGNEGKG